MGGTVGIVTALLVALGVLVVLVAVLAAVRAATRLDRLHVRTDAAWLGLDGALVRRAVVARTLAAAGGLRAGPGGRPHPAGGEITAVDGQLTAAANRAVAGGPDREIAENELGRMLAALDRAGLDAALAVELADAEARVAIARRVYNDAVRDTRALRSRRAVRWLRLAGTAPLPRYFEIIEPAPLDRECSR